MNLMLNKLTQLFSNQSGYMVYFLIVGVVLVAMFFIKIPFAPNKNVAQPSSTHYCRELINDPNAPVIDAPVYTTTGVDTSNQRKHKLIKKNVPVPYYFLIDTPKQHFFNDFERDVTDSNGKKYTMRIPNGEGGASYKLPSDVGTEDYLIFADYGLIFLFHLQDDGQPLQLDEFDMGGGNMMKANVADIYKAVDLPELPEWVLKCHDAGVGGSQSSVFKNRGAFKPTQTESVNKNELQLEYFLLRNYTLLLTAWWTPHCKPAVYLYPPKQQLVNVKVRPNGFLIYMDPKYDNLNGWTVVANPDGTLINQSGNTDNQKLYDYLYFESKIKDQLITKPEKGWIIEYSKLNHFYTEMLPQLGFNTQQQKDFIEYWNKALPQANYYFVSLVDPKEIETYETLDITPRPDSVQRVRFYFEPREKFESIQPLTISEWYSATKRGEFHVFEWGGMFKQDKDHDFTCSM
jgi:hypothetical protein